MNTEDAKAISNKIASVIDELGSDHNMRRNRPYDGQSHTDTGQRGATEIQGITFRDLRDCFIRACCLSSGELAYHAEASKGEEATLCENDIYKLPWDEMDQMAVCQNLCCEVERLMGIFPNLPSDDNPDACDGGG